MQLIQKLNVVTILGRRYSCFTIKNTIMHLNL